MAHDIHITARCSAENPDEAHYTISLPQEWGDAVLNALVERHHVACTTAEPCPNAKYREGALLDPGTEPVETRIGSKYDADKWQADLAKTWEARVKAVPAK
jgi:hypothetical protein